MINIFLCLFKSKSSMVSGHTPNFTRTVRGIEETVHTSSLCIIVNKSAELSKSEIVDRVTIGANVYLFTFLSLKIKCSLDVPGII